MNQMAFKIKIKRKKNRLHSTYTFQPRLTSDTIIFPCRAFKTLAAKSLIS